MPITRIDMMRGKPAHYRDTLRDTIYAALTEVIGILDGDRFEIINEHDPSTLNISPDFLGIQRTRDALIIQITFNEGSPDETKLTFYETLVAALQTNLGLRPQDVTINLVEVKKENWSFGNGDAPYADPA